MRLYSTVLIHKVTLLINDHVVRYFCLKQSDVLETSEYFCRMRSIFCVWVMTVPSEHVYEKLLDTGAFFFSYDAYYSCEPG
jgi:hypothetical protein